MKNLLFIRIFTVTNLFLSSFFIGAAGAADSSITVIPIDKPKQGAFLVATDKMPDPRFRQTVILLIKYDEGGTMGLVINRKTEFTLSDIVKDDNLPDLPVFLGGPVAAQALLALLLHTETLEQANLITDDIYWTTNPQLMKQQFSADNNTLRLYFGYAGWSAGQLEQELTQQGWRLFEASFDAVFAADTETLWQQFIGDTALILAALQMKSN